MSSPIRRFNQSSEDRYQHAIRRAAERGRAPFLPRPSAPADPGILGFDVPVVGVTDFDVAPDGATRWARFTLPEVRWFASEHPDARIRARARREVNRRERWAWRVGLSDGRAVALGLVPSVSLPACFADCAAAWSDGYTLGRSPAGRMRAGIVRVLW